MFHSNNLSNCNFSDTLLIQYQMSNLPAVDPHHFLFETQEIYSQLNLISTALLTAISSTWLLWLSTTSRYSPNELTRVQINATYIFLSL